MIQVTPPSDTAKQQVHTEVHTEVSLDHALQISPPANENPGKDDGETAEVERLQAEDPSKSIHPDGSVAQASEGSSRDA